MSISTPVNHFRTDIQGLRAVAVGVVVLWHAGVPFVSGGYVGVDVFFVISGFLISSLLLREIRTTGRISLANFYARRVRRILPAGTFTLVITALASWLFVPATLWKAIGEETAASGLYVVNWLLARNTDYLNAESAPSPLQHYWSLSVEEQYYIVWPLLIVFLLLVKKKWAHTLEFERFAFVGVLILGVPSFLWSVYYTQAHAAPAYFVTTTRLWELAIGAGIAATTGVLAKIPHRIGLVLGWIGLAGIVGSSLSFSEYTSFPGYSALVPVLGAGAIIVGGMSKRDKVGVGRILSTPVFQYFGNISYSWYLWHWPVLVIGGYLLEGIHTSWNGIMLVTLSLMPTIFSYRFIEKPFQRWSYLKMNVKRSLASGIVMMSMSIIAAGGLLLALHLEIDRESTTNFAPETTITGDIGYGASSFTGKYDPVPAGTMIPGPLLASDDVPSVYERGCHQEKQEIDTEACIYGDPESEKTVMLVGDSHAAQWIPALVPLAKENGWRLESYTKSSCPLTASPLVVDGKEYGECEVWGQKMLQLIEERKPSGVIVSALVGVRQSEDYSGIVKAWDKLKEEDIPVVVIRDTPYVGVNIPDCLVEAGAQTDRCAVDREDALRAGAYEGIAKAARSSDTKMVDLTEYICPLEGSLVTAKCNPVEGGVIVYRDGHHLSASYATTLAPLMQAALLNTGYFDSLFVQ